MTTLSKEDVVQEQIDRWIEAAGFVRSSDDWVCAAKKFAFARLATLARADLVAENERLKATPPDQRQDLHCVVSDISAECRELRTALAAVVSDNEQLRIALEYKHDSVDALMAWCVKNVDKWHFSQYDNVAYAIEKMRDALAQPRDDSALRDLIAGGYEECAKVCDGKDGDGNIFADDAAKSIRALAEKAKVE